MLTILVFAWCFISVFGQTDFNHQTFLDVQENVELLWKVEGEEITFEVRANTTGYVGIGLSNKGAMKGADILIAWVKDGTPYLSDRHGIGNEEPTVDTKSDYELLYGSEAEGLTVIGYRRKLITCDSNDYDISADTARVLWSYHPEDPDEEIALYHGPQRRGVKSVILIDVLSANLNSLPDDIKQFDIAVDNYVIRSTEVTTYWSTHVELPPLSTPHHVIRIDPIVQPGNEGIVHHFILKECFGLTNITGNRSVLYTDSEAMYQFRSCQKIVYAWAIGGGPLVYPENVGYRIGDTDSTKFLSLTVHYDNLQLVKGIKDNSGIRIYYTDKLREFDSNVLMVGVPSLSSSFVIPPMEESFTVYGTCDNKCLKEIITEEDMKVFAVFLHAHLAGVSIRVSHFRNGEYIGEISRDSSYDFNLQEFRYLKDHWIIKPEDDILVECVYNTMDRDTPTFGGLETTDEMCLAFFSYYPQSNMGRCYGLPQPEHLESALNLGDLQNTSTREALRNTEWTSGKRDSLKEFWYGSPYMSYCSNYTGHPIFPKQYRYGYVETQTMNSLIDIQNEITVEQCSSATKIKSSLIRIAILTLMVSLFQITK